MNFIPQWICSAYIIIIVIRYPLNLYATKTYAHYYYYYYYY